jgi:transposase
MTKLDLTPYERRKLRQQLHRTSDARLYQRLLAVLEIDQGRPVNEVAHLLNVSGQSVYNWVDRFCQQRQIADLVDQYGIGRPTLWTEERAAGLRALLESSPDQWGYFANDWTVPLLQEQLLRCTGQAFAEDTVRRELDRLGYVWKRGRYLLAPDPELEKKTADSQKSPGFAAPERAPGRGRNRPVAVPAVAGRLGAARSTPRGPA